jgi:hypothetical protein
VNVTSRLAWLDAAALTPVVRSALGRADLTVTTWDHEVVKAESRPDGRLVCRVTGMARADGCEDLPWSVFLKVPNATHTHRDALYREPFQREVLLYESGLLDDLPGGIVAPRLLGVTRRADDQPCMWLQDVTGLPALQWPLERFGHLARQFGRMQGAFLASGPPPDLPWLETGHWLRGRFLAGAPAAAETWERFSEHPLTRQLYQSNLGRRLTDLWERREKFLRALEAMPSSLCHGDFNYTNLFAPQEGDVDQRSFVVDWQYAGWRQIGSDITGLIADCSVAVARRKAAEPEEFLALVLPAWLEGLREAGWHGDPDVPRFSCLARLAVPWTFCLLQGLNGGVLSRPITPETKADLEQKVEKYVRNQRFLLSVADEAWRILDRGLHLGHC